MSQTAEVKKSFESDSPAMRDLQVADGVLANLVIVDEADLRSKYRREVPTRLTVSAHTQEKFNAFAARHGLKFDINENLKRAKDEQVTNKLRHSFSDAFGIKPDAKCRVLAVRVNLNTTICFIVADNVVVEMVSWRGLRQLRKRALHRAQVQPAGMKEAERIKEVSKKVFKVRIQGGLIRQENCPRDRWR